jgi:hypothetical protein
MGAVMSLMDEAVWRGKIYSGGWVTGDLAAGTGARFGGSANLKAFTDTRWVTIRGDITPYPF